MASMQMDDRVRRDLKIYACEFDVYRSTAEAYRQGVEDALTLVMGRRLEPQLLRYNHPTPD